MGSSTWPDSFGSTPGCAIYQGDKIHVLGDSLTAGYAWFSPLETLVAAATDETGTSMSVSWTFNGTVGISSDGIRLALSTMLFPYNPDVVIIESGRNDGAGTTTQQEYGYYLALLDAIRAWKPAIRIIAVSCMWGGELWAQTGVQPPTWNNTTGGGGMSDATCTAINNGIRLACAKRGVTFADARAYSLQWEPNYNAGKATSGGLTVDGTHPNSNGQTVMSRGVFNCMSFGSAAVKVAA